MTVLVGIACFFLIHDYPSSARFLSEQERTYVVRRLQTDSQFSAGGEQLRWRDARKSLTEWKTWVGALVVIGQSFSKNENIGGPKTGGPKTN